jgi:hypothetical protein
MKETDAALNILHGRRGAVREVIGEVDEELSEAAFGGGVIAEHGREGGIPKGFGQALPQSLPGSAVVAQAISSGLERHRNHPEK